MCSKRTRSKIWKEDCKRFDQIIEAAKSDKELRIWFASSPHSRCGLYFLVYSLQHIDCQIYVVEMPTNIGYREEGFDKSWGEATPEEARNCLKLERLLSIEERNDISRKWAKLAEENAELRLNVNGEVTSLPIDYLDKEIMSYAPKDKEFKLGNLVGTTLGKCVHAVSDAFIADRIEAMIEGGLFVVVGDRPKKAREYYSKTFIRVATDEDNLEQKVRVTENGVERHYGFAKYLHDSLPNATYVGFTGTPVDATIDVFGSVVDRYTMTESVKDGITVNLVYEGRAAKVTLDKDKLEEIEAYYEQCEEEGANEHQIEESKKAIANLDVILGDPDRLQAVAQDFVAHYEKRVKEGGTVCGKAMFVCSTRQIAFKLYQYIKEIRPSWVEIREADDGVVLSEKERKEIKPIAKMNMVMTRSKDDPKELWDLLGSAI